MKSTFNSFLTLGLVIVAIIILFNVFTGLPTVFTVDASSIPSVPAEGIELFAKLLGR